MTRKPFDLARLFEPRRPPTPLYASLEDELDAIKTGQKAMSAFWPRFEDLTDRGSHYFELLELAFARDLLVVANADPMGLPRREAPHPNVFVTRPDQLWRVPAFLALDEARYTRGTSDPRSWLALDAQKSVLLGYTAAQWRAHNERWRQREDGLYVLLTHAQKQRVVDYGRQCFGTPDEVEGMTFFFHRAGRVRRNAASLVPKSFTLARARTRSWSMVIGKPSKRRRHLITHRVSGGDAQVLNDALEGPIDFMTARGWQ